MPAVAVGQSHGDRVEREGADSGTLHGARTGGSGGPQLPLRHRIHDGPRAGEAKAIGLRTAVQIVGAIYVVVGHPALEGAIKDLKLEYLSDPQDSGWRAVVTIHNWSLMHFRPVGDLDVLAADGTLVESVHFVPLPVLPKRDQNFVFPLKLAAGLGHYTLRARVDLGDNEIQEATALVVATKPNP